MGKKNDLHAMVDSEGRLILPKEVLLRHGLKPGAKLPIGGNEHSIILRRPINHLAKVYIEPTNQCNLKCRTCIRNIWDEPQGMMDEKTFERAVEGLRIFSPPPVILFGGFGEPLFHSGIVAMVSKAKCIGSPVELITNGTLLTEELSRQLIEAGLDVLWVSLDGATPESYADIRLGALLPEVLANVTRYRDIHLAYRNRLPQMGIVFVAMKRNIADLPAVMRLGRKLGTDRILVTNVLPYVEEMGDEVLYNLALNDLAKAPSPWLPHLNLSKMDMNEDTCEPLYKIIRVWRINNFAQEGMHTSNNYCPFIESGSTAICWDGGMSPCLPLLHTHTSFLNEHMRVSRRYVVGNVNERSVGELWNTPEYVALRERVQTFDFSPCTFCGGCDLSKANEEDCSGNVFPTCGGCLWAQGVIHCP